MLGKLMSVSQDDYDIVKLMRINNDDYDNEETTENKL